MKSPPLALLGVMKVVGDVAFGGVQKRFAGQAVTFGCLRGPSERQSDSRATRPVQLSRRLSPNACVLFACEFVCELTWRCLPAEAGGHCGRWNDSRCGS